MKRGFVLTEILVIIGVVLAISTLSFKIVQKISQKAKRVSAKAQISQIALALELARDDAGYYPVSLETLTREKAPLCFPENCWKGPYIKGNIPLDPWGHDYFYNIPVSDHLPMVVLIRGYGIQVTETFNFQSCGVEQALLRIENYEVTSSRVTLNGEIVVNENEFKKTEGVQIIEKEITVLENDTLSIWTRSKPGTSYYLRISGLRPTREYFNITSYGRDGKEGGTGVNEDITWVSNKYPNFQ